MSEYTFYAWGWIKPPRYSGESWAFRPEFKLGITGREAWERGKGIFQSDDYFDFSTKRVVEGYYLKLIHCTKIRGLNGREEEAARALEKYMKNLLFNNKVFPNRQEFFTLPEGDELNPEKYLTKHVNIWIAYRAAKALEIPTHELNFKFWTEETNNAYCKTQNRNLKDFLKDKRYREDKKAEFKRK